MKNKRIAILKFRDGEEKTLYRQRDIDRTLGYALRKYEDELEEILFFDNRIMIERRKLVRGP